MCNRSMRGNHLANAPKAVNELSTWSLTLIIHLLPPGGLFKRNYFKKCIIKPVKMFNYIYNNYELNFFGENLTMIHCCEIFADVNAVYFTALQWIMNDWDWFETLKTQLLGKRIWILFLLWKWIKYTFVLFVLKRCLELGVLLWNQLELLYSLRNKIGAGPPFIKFLLFILGNFFKIKMI